MSASEPTRGRARDAAADDPVVAHYEQQLARHGATAQGMDWKDDASQRLRFAVLCDVADLAGRSVHDVGAGAGHLLDYLQEQGIAADYSGSDASRAMVAAARGRHPDVSFGLQSIAEEAGHGPNVVARLVGSTFLSFHLTNPVHVAAIADSLRIGEQWDVVVIQGFSTEATEALGSPVVFLQNAASIFANDPSRTSVLASATSRKRSGSRKTRKSVSARISSFAVAARSVPARWRSPLPSTYPASRRKSCVQEVVSTMARFLVGL